MFTCGFSQRFCLKSIEKTRSIVLPLVHMNLPPPLVYFECKRLSLSHSHNQPEVVPGEWNEVLVALWVPPCHLLPLLGQGDGLGDDPNDAPDGTGVHEHDDQAGCQVCGLVSELDIGTVADGIRSVGMGSGPNSTLLGKRREKR